MELNPGYKLTEIGVIPEEWDVVRIGDLFTFKNGLNKAKEFFGHGTPIVNYMDVFGRPRLYSEAIRGSVEVTSKELSAYEVRKGDVFFTRTSETVEEIGIAAVMLDDPESTVYSGFVLRARPMDSSLDNLYKAYSFSPRYFRQQVVALASYTTRALTNGRSLSAVVLARPPLPEQRAIAKALRDVDELLTELDRLIAKKRDLKQAAMQQLLTGKTRLPGFRAEWDVKKIGEFSDCTAGGTPSTRIPSYWGGPIRWMSSGELNMKRIQEVEGRITEMGVRASSTKLIPIRCVLIGLAGQGKTRGTVAMNFVELCTNQSIAAIFPNDKFYPEYLYYNLDSRYDELRELSAGDGGRGGLNLKIIKGIPIPFPSIDEQIAIADVLTTMDAEIDALKQRRDKTNDLKQGMMQDLLTGRIRLV
jgi:type I restriction enzyme S subunit